MRGRSKWKGWGDNLNPTDLTRLSGVVVIGPVQKKSPSTTVKAQEGGQTVERIYTDYRFKVRESLRVPYSGGQEVTSRLSESRSEGCRFREGDHVLFFLASNTGPAGFFPTDGEGSFTVEKVGDYSWKIGWRLCQPVFWNTKGPISDLHTRAKALGAEGAMGERLWCARLLYSQITGEMHRTGHNRAPSKSDEHDHEYKPIPRGGKAW